MDRQPHTSTREVIVANSIMEVVSELRLIDVADYVAFIRLERFACIADLVDTAAELYFVPGTLKLGHGGPPGVTVYFALTLADSHAAVEVNYVSFDKPSPNPTENDGFLEAALEGSRIRKTETVAE